MRGEPIYRGILGIDIEGFNRPEWTDPTRARLRARLHRLVDRAIAVAEIALSSTVRTDTGDGLWLLVSSEVSTARLLHPLVSRLASGLAGDNQQVPAAERLRLRVAVHAGEVLHDPYGHTGASFNHAARLLDAEATRAVLAASPTADVVLVVSDTVYEGVVRHGYEGIDPAGWQPIRIHAKETTTRAWVHLPGLAAQPPLPAALVASRVGPPSLPIPRELPFPPTDFTGRGGELADLRALIATGVAVDRAAGGVGVRAGGAGRPGPVAIIAIDGMGGIGKSALALQIAHQLADAGAFPDGQLYVNLHGATPGLAPLAPLDALGRLLRALGVDPAAVPTEVEEAAARFRSVLPPEHALALLGRIVGEQRLVADPGAAAEVVRRCGRLPLALRIAGARLAARPAWPVQVLAEQLADATHRLEELTVGELAVRASFDVSLRALQESPDPVDRAAAAAFGLCSLPDGPDLSLAAAVRLLDRPEPATHALLERLVDAQLLESLRPGRYRFHDLVRLYAREHATGQHPEPERLAALARLFGFYTATAWHIMTLLDPGNPRPATADPRWTGGGLPFTDELVALAWLETERANLLAAIAQAAQAAPAVPAELAGQLTRALYGLFETRGYWQDGLQANQTALRLARRTGNGAAQASAHEDLGVIYLRLGRYADASTSAQASLALHRKLGDRQGQADSLNHLAVVYRRLGRFAEASTCVQESLVLSRELGDRHGQDNSLANLGRVYGRVGRYVEAIDCLQESLVLGRELRNRWHQADSLQGLGMVYGRVGRFVEAINCLQESLVLSRELRNRSCQADSLQGLGIVHGRQGRFVEAIACLQESLTLRRELGEHHGQAEALRDLGDALQAGAQQQQAEAAWQEALIICEALQLPEAEELRGRLAALPPGTPEPAGGR